jgi:NhaP-type Na+/H+ and K+/H+ antiporter
VGIVVSVAIVGVVAHFLLGFSLHTALLIGAVLSSTGAAAVFSTLRWQTRLRTGDSMLIVATDQVRRSAAPAARCGEGRTTRAVDCR